MALGIFLVSTLIAFATAIGTAVAGGSWLAVIGWGIGTAWLSSLALIGFLFLRLHLGKSGEQAPSAVLVPAGLTHRPF